MTSIINGCPRCSKGYYRSETDHYGAYWTCDNCGYVSDIETAEGDQNPMQDMVYVGTNEEYEQLKAGLRVLFGKVASNNRYKIDSHHGFAVYCPMLVSESNRRPWTPCGLEMVFQDMENIQHKSGRVRSLGGPVPMERPTMRYKCDRNHVINATQSHMGWL